MKNISITHMSNKHNEWLRSLNFYKQEINILKGRLTEIGGKNTGDDVSKHVEQFENKFKVHVDNIDRLNHDITENITEAGKQAKDSGAGYIDAQLFSKHDELEQAFHTEEKSINSLRQEFNQFAAAKM